MTIATITGTGVALFIVAAVFVRLRGRPTPGSALGRTLRWVALAAAVGIAVAALPAALDGGGIVPYLLAVPALASLAAVVSDVTGTLVGTTTAAAALLVLGWGVFLASFLTPYFVFPALVLGVAAIASIRPRHEEAADGGERGVVHP